MAGRALYRNRSITRRILPSFAVTLSASISTGVPAAAGDIELGRYLGRECETCHRASVAGTGIPIVHGMSEPKLIVLVKAYRDRQLPNPIMQSIAARLKDDEIAALATYLSVTKAP